jgi:hypothetical protein
MNFVMLYEGELEKIQYCEYKITETNIILIVYIYTQKIVQTSYLFSYKIESVCWEFK